MTVIDMWRFRVVMRHALNDNPLLSMRFTSCRFDNDRSKTVRKSALVHRVELVTFRPLALNLDSHAGVAIAAEMIAALGDAAPDAGTVTQDVQRFLEELAAKELLVAAGGA